MGGRTAKFRYQASESAVGYSEPIKYFFNKT